MKAANPVVEANLSRFIDLASDGGCSKKAPATDLRCMLSAVGHSTGSAEFQALATDLPDVGRFSLPSSELIATMDVIYPMTIDAGDFGKITAIHALNDICAAFGQPQMALSLVGVPSRLDAFSPQIVQMMSGATAELQRSGVSLVGGHTLSRQSDLFFGFAVIGTPMPRSMSPSLAPAAGDAIILTKRLGTSVATIIWKSDASRDTDFLDVLNGMKQSSVNAAKCLHAHGIQFATDVSGFGLLNHLHLLLKRVRLGGRLKLSELPTYTSILVEIDDLPVTSQYYYNLEFSRSFSNCGDFINNMWLPLAVDSQVAGGLLSICPKYSINTIRTQLEKFDIELHVIGECVAEGDGFVEIVT